MMKVSKIIKERVDQNDIQSNFFSKSTIEILSMLSNEIAENPLKLKDVILKHFSPYEMLRDKNIRNLLLVSLHETEATELLKSIHNNKSKYPDPYKSLLKTGFAKNSRHEKVLFEFFEENLPSNKGYEISSKQMDTENVDTTRQMFLHQRHAITKIEKLLSSGKKKCLLHMPTGSGKTTTAMRIVGNLFLNSSPTMVIWLAYNEELCEQAIEEFKKTWSNIGDRRIRLFRYFRGYTPDLISKTKNCKESIVFASLNKLNFAEQKGNVFLSTLSDRTDMVVMDEAHQAMAPTYMNILQQLVEKRFRTTRLLGLSATPGRTANIQESLKLAGFFNRNKVTLEIEGYENPVKYLIDNGYLAKPNSTLIHADGNLNQEDLHRIDKNFIDIPEDILKKIGKNTKRTLKIITEIQKLVNAGHKRIIVFGASVENSRDIHTILAALGYKSFHVDQNTSFESRNNFITKYKTDSYDTIIMCNYGVFTTGFDAPKTSAVIIARPTKSVILFSQMAGRAMRGEKVKGNKKCEIRTVTDVNLPQFTELVEGFFNWEEIW